jgi:hypothetical protein
VAGSAYPAGSLLEGHNHFVYYVTGSGSRQPIYDRDTLTAFGWQEQAITRVKEDNLAALPVADPLTRLVEDEQGNLYRAAQGQLWQVNEWWRHRISAMKVYREPPGQPLAETAGSPVCPRAYLRQGEQLYYFINQASSRPRRAGNAGSN